MRSYLKVMSPVVLVFGRRLPRRGEAPVIPASENQRISGLMRRDAYVDFHAEINSAAISGRRSTLSAQRTSMTMFLPST